MEGGGHKNINLVTPDTEKQEKSTTSFKRELDTKAKMVPENVWRRLILTGRSNILDGENILVGYTRWSGVEGMGKVAAEDAKWTKAAKN